MTAEAEKQTTIYLIANEKMMRVDVPVREPFAYPEPDADEPSTPAPSAESAQPPSAESNAELVRGITAAFQDCEARLRGLCEGDENSPLYRADVEMQRLLDSGTATMPFVRSSVVASAENTIKYGEWRPLAIFDMAQKEVSAHYAPKFVTDYASLQPAKTGVRLLVLETAIMVDDVTVLLRFCAFFMAEHRYAAQLSVYDAKFGASAALPTASLLNDASTVNNTPQAAHTVRIVNVFHDFLILQQTEKSKAKAKASLDKLGEKSTKLDEAMLVYRRKREAVRHRALFHNASTLIAFMLRYFATTLVERYEHAKPNVPEQLMIHVNVEAAGTTVNLDETHCVGLGAISKLIESSSATLARLEADVKPVTAQSSDKEKAAFVTAHQTIAMHHHQLVKLKQAEEKLKQCNPATQVLFSIVEAGKWQDKGTAIEAFFTIEVPYPLLCAQYAQMRAEHGAKEGMQKKQNSEDDEQKVPATPLLVPTEEQVEPPVPAPAAQKSSDALRAIAAVLGAPPNQFHVVDEKKDEPVEAFTLTRLL